MNKTKKKVLVIALAVCLIATLSMGTLAWFTAQDEVTNKFMVGDSTTTPDKVFGVDVWEEVDTDRDPATPLEVIGKEDTTENSTSYEAILPGEAMTKKPYLTNTGIHPQFVRAIVTVTPASILKDPMGDDWKNADLFLAGTDAAKWKLDSLSYTNDGTESKLVYVYYYQDVLAAGATTEAIFDAVVIPTELNYDQAKQMEDFKVNVVGQAIQSEHLADPAVPGAMITTAKAAFETFWSGVPVYNGASDLVFSGDFDAAIETPANQAYTMMYVSDANITGETAVEGTNTVATIALTNVTATVDNVVVLEEDNTVIIEDADFTLPAGGKLVVNNSTSTTVQVMVHNVTVNGVQLTNASLRDYLVNCGFAQVY